MEKDKKLTASQFVDFNNYWPNETIKIIDGNTIEKEYKKLFNSNINYTGDKVSGFCPFFMRDTKTNYYMTNPECGGTCYPTLIYNKRKYTTYKNYIYVYVDYLVYGVCAYNGKVYKDYDSNDDKELYTEKDIEKVKKDLVNNPDKYSHYRLVFEKNSEGTYYYKTTEVSK